MSLPSPLKKRILLAYERSRTKLPPVSDVQSRPNVRRLASLSRRRGPRATLNLSLAVVDAGEPAWLLVAPALEGDRSSLRQLRELTREGVEKTRRERASARGGREDRGRAGALPDTPCQGTAEQRRYLLDLIRFVRETSGHPAAIPDDVQVRISRRMTSTLGSCTYRGRSRRITIAERLFRPGLEDLLWDTVKHELAHLADQVTGDDGRSGHGPRWRRWAVRLGARPDRLCAPHHVERIEAAGRSGPKGPLAYPPPVLRWLGETAVLDAGPTHPRSAHRNGRGRP